MINDTALANICEHVRNGETWEKGCQRVGISAYLFYAALERGRSEQFHRQNGGIPHKRLEMDMQAYVMVGRAQAEFEAEMLAHVKTQAREDWKAAKFLLEAHNPGTYGGETYGGALLPATSALELGE